jgi:uncharacterized membrane protein YqaE (UPF0057 family)
MRILPAFLTCVMWQLVQGGLTFNATFENLNDWVIHIDGSTGVVNTVNQTSNGYIIPNVTDHDNPHYLFTNITHCPNNGCYRAEVAVLQSLRPTVIPNCSAEYWAGTSIYIPTSWQWKASAVEDVTYHFQIHGGDNEGSAPVLGIQFDDNEVVINICGNTYGNSPPICSHYNLGGVATGMWMDFVINSQLAFGNPTGWVKIWRNNELMLNVQNLLTAYNQTNPPYIIAGSYNINWKANVSLAYNWAASYHKAVRVGDAGSDYSQVYTGDGTPCGSYCGGGSSPSSRKGLFDENWYWFIVPMSLIFVCSVILFFGSSSYRINRKHFLSLPQFRERESEQSHRQQSFNSDALSYSYGKFLVGGLFDNHHNRPEGEEEHSPTDWESMISPFRNASLTRTIFWYAFAVLFTGVAFFLALVLYGGPQIFLHYNLGVIPWEHVSQWGSMQLTLAVITATMMVIYFFPLIYLPHDFEAGRKWKNDPKFLKKIGVIIPCHKSAGEIGEVLRRCLKYFPPDNIVVCDNGNFDWPPDHTFEVVKKVSKKIRYVYIKQGHKTRALWTGVHRLPKHVEYVIHLDDDTHFDEDHMVFDEKHFDEKHVIAIAFLRSSYPTNRVTEFTDFWYKITDHFHATQAKICTRCFVPGPAGLWKREKFMEIFGQHPTLPFGEDIFGGFTTLNNGYAIRSETRCMVTTFAPDILLPWSVYGQGRVQGYGASSLWKQRAHRWTVSALRITGKSLYSFFTYDSRLGFWSNVAFRLYRFREYKLIVMQLLYLPFCAVIVARGFYIEFILTKFLLFALPFVRNVYINYICWRNQPELQVSVFLCSS